MRHVSATVIRRRLAIAWVTVVMVAGHAPDAAAHAGHDHGPQVEVSANVAPRFEAASDAFELLAVLRADTLSLTLDRFRTNEPVVDARVEATVNGDAASVEPQADGTYLLRAAALARPGRAEVVFTITAGDETDLLGGAIEVPGAASTAATPTTLTGRLTSRPDLLWTGLFAFSAGALVTLLLRRPARGPATGLALALMASWTAPLEAAEPAKVTITADLPQRLADGTLFIPKVTQRLLSIRTVMAGETRAGATFELNGQIVVDPAGFGRVQAYVDGRIDAPATGLVVVGQAVERGQVLAVLTPIVASADRSSFESAVGEIDTRIALAEQKLARLTRIPGVVAQKDIDDTRTEVDSLKTRRAAVRSAIREPLPLAAPVGGIVSLSSAIPGQLANAREVLFEIVDPARLWVEAIAYDARLVGEITAARATTKSGDSLVLELAGRGVTARQQGIPIHYRIVDPPKGLVLGTPVSVLVTTREARHGLILPQTAVVKGQNGLPIVWTHTQAERFKPNIVRVTPIDDQRLLVEGGLAANERVVVEGATLLNQVR